MRIAVSPVLDLSIDVAKLTISGNPMSTPAKNHSPISLILFVSSQLAPGRPSLTSPSGTAKMFSPLLFLKLMWTCPEHPGWSAYGFAMKVGRTPYFIPTVLAANCTDEISRLFVGSRDGTHLEEGRVVSHSKDGLVRQR